MTPAIAPASIRSLRSPGGRAAQGPPLLSAVAIPLSARAAATAAVAATSAAPVVAARPVLLRRTRRRVLRPLDQLLRLDEAAVLVLRDELEADAAARLVDLLHDHVDDVAPRHDVLDVADAAGTDVRDVEQAVGALLQLDEGAELRRLHDLAGVGVACSGASRMICCVTPVILMSIWSAVMPSREPATLKSMSPRWSSAPWMSVRIT